MGQQMERAMRLHEVTFFELWETAMVLEPKTASLAVVHLGGADIEALELNLAKTAQSLNDPTALAALDVEFHALIARGVHNRVLLLTREPMARLFYPSFEAVLSRVSEASTRLLKAHQAILPALKNGNSEEAATWMEKHIKDFKVGFELASLNFQSNEIKANEVCHPQHHRAIEGSAHSFDASSSLATVAAAQWPNTLARCTSNAARYAQAPPSPYSCSTRIDSPGRVGIQRHLHYVATSWNLQ